VKLQW